MSEWFRTDGFPPRWLCGTWSTSLGWAHIVSDLFIACHYVAFAVLIVRFYRSYEATRAAAMAAVAFFLFCAGDHVQFALQFYWPNYPFHGYVWKPLECLSVLLFAYAFLAVELPHWQSPRQTRIRESELMAIANATAVAFYVVAPDGCCTIINDEMLDVIGYKRSEVLAQNMHELIHYQKHDGTPYPLDECRMFEAMKRDRFLECKDDTIIDRHGLHIPVSWRSTPVRLDGRVTATRIEVFPHDTWDRNTHLLRRAAKHTEQAIRDRN